MLLMFHQCYSFGHAEIGNGILLLFHVSEFGLPIFCLHFFCCVGVDEHSWPGTLCLSCLELRSGWSNKKGSLEGFRSN